MHIALIMERIEAWRGGAETSTLLFCNHLSALGCAVTVVTASHVPSTPAMRVVPIRARRRLRGMGSWLFARRAADYVTSHSFDVVHAITPCLAADVYQPRGGAMPETLARNLAIRSDRADRGFKWIQQRLNLKYRLMAGLERRLVTRQPPPWLIAISGYVADQFIRHYGCDGGRIRRIFNGVDPDETPAEQRRRHRVEIRRQLGLADDDLMLLIVAHNFKLKGVSKAIEALARRADHTHLVIVGRDDPSSCAGLAERLGVHDRVKFAGSSRRTQAFYHAADILVHPTFYDPCSRVVLEALASGLPPITTRFNGAAERINDGREGYVIESAHDVEALADRIERLADADHRRQCAERAPAAVADVSMREHAARVMELYGDVARDPGRR